MLTAAIWLALAMIAAAIVLNLERLVRGPDILDRILALDTLNINSAALLILFGMQLGTGLYFEAVALIALMGFVGTVALCKYVLRGDVIE